MNHASLFSGIGGFDLAAEWVGWNNVFNCEIEEFPRKVLNYHFPNAIQYHDIKRTDFTVHAGTIDVLSGGFPCQPFSVAGKRQGKNDERHLWPEMYRAIQEIRPRYIVGENVRGLLSWNDGLVLDEVYTDLESQGYEVLTFVLPAASVNAPHKRDRVWIIAHDTQDSMRGGLLQRKSLQEGTEVRQQWDIGTGNSDWIHREEGSDASDTNNTRTRKPLSTHEEWSQDDKGWQGQSQFESGQKSGNGHASHTKSIGHRGSTSQGGEEEQHRVLQGKQGWSQVGSETQGRSGKWDTFPTQSPICGGDDGLPRELDNLTFPKWRRESIKAYGNAIVPQIAYRIFQSINLTDHE